MSAAALERLLAPVRVQVGKRGLSGTKPDTWLKNKIPLQGCRWDTAQPGFIEANTVQIAAQAWQKILSGASP